MSPNARSPLEAGPESGRPDVADAAICVSAEERQEEECLSSLLGILWEVELGQPAIFIVVPDLLDHLRSTFSPSSETTFDDLFESVRGAPLLILDDLGTQTTTQWATEKLFQILNHRYMTKLPTVITTNVPLDELGDRLASRMADPELSICVSLAGPDWRAARDSSAPRGAGPTGRRGARQQGRTH